MMGKLVGVAEFKAHCARIIAEVERTGEPVTVTNRGRPVVEVKAVETQETERPSLIGCMRGMITFLHEDDALSAFDPDWEEQWEANNPPELYR
jgi:prevent-host-death family protein